MPALQLCAGTAAKRTQEKKKKKTAHALWKTRWMLFLTDDSAMEKNRGRVAARPVTSRSSAWRIMDTAMSHPYCLHLAALGSTATLFSLQSCRPDRPRVDSRCRLPRALPTLQISLGKEVVCTQLLRIRVGKSHGRLQGVHICSLLAQDFRAVTRKLDGQGPWCGSPKPMLAAISASPTYPGITVRLIASDA